MNKKLPKLKKGMIVNAVVEFTDHKETFDLILLDDDEGLDEDPMFQVQTCRFPKVHYLIEKHEINFCYNFLFENLP